MCVCVWWVGWPWVWMKEGDNGGGTYSSGADDIVELDKVYGADCKDGEVGFCVEVRFWFILAGIVV